MKEVTPYSLLDDDNILEVCDNWSKEHPINICINNNSVQLTQKETEDAIDTMIEILNQQKYKD